VIFLLSYHQKPQVLKRQSIEKKRKRGRKSIQKKKKERKLVEEVIFLLSYHQKPQVLKT
jgi:hypothetical protein